MVQEGYRNATVKPSIALSQEPTVLASAFA